MSAVGRVVSTDNELLCMYVVHTVHDVLGPALFRVVYYWSACKLKLAQGVRMWDMSV